MSTRAMYSFVDEHETHHVYKHHDGYPTGAAEWINAAVAFAWPLPRYEASDFAAAFVAANKLASWLQEPVQEHLAHIRGLPRPTGFKGKKSTLKADVPAYAIGGDFGRGGGVYLMPSGFVYDVAHGDLEYRYEIYQGSDGLLRVKAYSVGFWDGAGPDKENLLTDCPMSEFAAWAKADAEEKAA